MLQKDIIFVTETWRDSKSQKTYSLDGYQNAFANGKTEKGKGVAVLLKEVCEEDLYQFIKFSNRNVTIFCLYISKGCNFDNIIQSLKDYDFNNEKEKTFLIGDLNFDVIGTNVFSRFLLKLKFVQMVDRETHLDGHILDHV